jgi:hypothetical protein
MGLSPDRDTNGIRIKIGPYRGAVHAELDTPEFRAALSDIQALMNAPSARVLLDKRNLVASVTMPVSPSDHRDAVIKEFRPSGFKRLKTIAVAGKADKAWRGATACLARGVRTPFPMAWLERRRRGFVVESYFLAAFEPDAVEIRSLFPALPPEDLSRLLAGLAGFLRKGHDRGILHRDLSDGNVLVRRPKPDAYEFTLIDTNRIRARRSISTFARVRNLVRLGVPPSGRDLFLRQYLGEGRNGRILRLWYVWAKGWYAGIVALKKRLHLKRLAEWLGIQ